MKKFKILLISFIAILVFWMTMLFTDYMQYKNNEKPIFTFNITHYDYADGYVNQYTGFGYKYIEYHRDNKSKTTFVPIWSPIEQ